MSNSSSLSLGSSRLFNAAREAHLQATESSTAAHLLEAPVSEAATAEVLRVRDPVRTLIARETCATRDLHRALSRLSGQNSLATWHATTSAKHCLYLSCPAVAIDPLGTRRFPRNGVNGRVHVLHAQRPEESIRLEAICTFELGQARVRYALAVQHSSPGAERGWQILRPVILVDPRVRACLGEGKRGLARIRLAEALDTLAWVISQGSHDYLHGTMMRWFTPPDVECDPRYAEVMVNPKAPDAIHAWQRCVNGLHSGPLRDTGHRENADPLEFWSLIVHARTVAELTRERPSRLTVFRDLLVDQLARLDAIARGLPSAELADIYALIGGLSLFFFFLIVPPASRELPSESVGDAYDVVAYAKTVHGGLAEMVHQYDREWFWWNGSRVGIFDVLREYADVLRALPESVVPVGV